MLFKKKITNSYQETYFNNSFLVVLSGLMNDYEYDKRSHDRQLSSSPQTVDFDRFTKSKDFDKIIKKSKELHNSNRLDKENLFSTIEKTKWIQKYKESTEKSFKIEDLDFSRFDDFIKTTVLIEKMDSNNCIKGRKQEFYDAIEPYVQNCFMLLSKTFHNKYYPFPDFQKGQPYYEETFDSFRSLCEKNKNLTATQALESVLDYYKIGAVTTRFAWNPEPYQKLDKAYEDFVEKYRLLNISKNSDDSIDEKKKKHRKRMP